MELLEIIELLGNKCPVCGYELLEPAYGLAGTSYEICSSCGTQFGHDDGVWGGNGIYSHDHLLRIFELRKEWMDGKMKFKHVDDPFSGKPANWDPDKQLSLLPEYFLSYK